jgi:peptide/nickel transport system substrate-binding protein
VKRTPRSVKLAALLAVGAIAAAACGDDGGKSTSTEAVTTAAPATSAAPGTTAAPVTSEAPGTTAVPATTAPPGGSGTITYAAEQEYTSYNNSAADQGLGANALVLNLTQPGPFISMPDLTFKLWDDMMDSAEITSTDPQVVVYKIKDAAVWSDGAPIDCSDFYLAWLSQNGVAGNRKNADGTDAKDADGNPVPVFNAISTTGYDQISKVECDATGKTVTSTYSSPFADWKGLFFNLLPTHIVAAKAGVADLTAALSPEDLLKVADVWNTGFIGFDPAMDLSGAWYTISEFSAGQNLILKKNDKFYGKPANADSIVFLQVPDATSEPQALANGDVQVISPQPNPDLLKQLEGLPGVTVSVNQGVTWEHYDLNLKNEFLSDLKVRQAFALCLNRDEIVKTLINPLNKDAAVLNNRVFMPGSPYAKDNMGEFGTQNIDKAKQLLTDAGFTFGADGIASKGGKPLKLRLGRRDPNPRRQSTNELAAEQCKPAGFDLVDDPAADFNSTRAPASDFDIALLAWQATATLSSYNAIYLPKDAGGGQNYNNWTDPKVKELTDAANKEFDDAKRADLYNQLDKLVTDNMVTIPLFQFQDLIAYTNNITGVVYNGPLGVTWNANEWAITS